MGTLAELNGLDSGLVKEHCPLEHVHRRSIKPGAEIDIAPAVVGLSFDHRGGSLAGKPRGMDHVLVPENPHGPCPLEGSQGVLHRTADTVVERKQPGGFPGPKYEMGKRLGTIRVAAYDQKGWSWHGSNLHEIRRFGLVRAAETGSSPRYGTSSLRPSTFTIQSPEFMSGA